MYKCLECGHIFDDGEQTSWIETHGFSDGMYELFTGCPICFGAYEDTVMCDECGGHFLPSELEDGLCPDCRGGDPD